MLPNRYSTLVLCVAVTVISAFFVGRLHGLWPMMIIAAGLSLLGAWDLVQPRHSIRRNYPVLGHVRWLAELVRPEIRQYLIESDQERAPFSRNQRSLVYARAKNEGSERSFGTQVDVYSEGYDFIGHSIRPAQAVDPQTFRITIGGDQCAQPYSASVFNISAMSFGALSANAIRALNKGAKLGGFAHDTGEGGFSPYHREHGGDIIWELGSGYFGCRTDEGAFDPERFAAQAANPQIKMIEIKLSQGAKPGHGGILPAEKVSAEIAAGGGWRRAPQPTGPSPSGAAYQPDGDQAVLSAARLPAARRTAVGHLDTHLLCGQLAAGVRRPLRPRQPASLGLVAVEFFKLSEQTGKGRGDHSQLLEVVRRERRQDRLPYLGERHQHPASVLDVG